MINDENPLESKKFEGAFLKKEINNFKWFDKFLSDFLTFAKNEEGIHMGSKKMD